MGNIIRPTQEQLKGPFGDFNYDIKNEKSYIAIANGIVWEEIVSLLLLDSKNDKMYERLESISNAKLRGNVTRSNLASGCSKIIEKQFDLITNDEYISIINAFSYTRTQSLMMLVKPDISSEIYQENLELLTIMDLIFLYNDEFNVLVQKYGFCDTRTMRFI